MKTKKNNTNAPAVPTSVNNMHDVYNLIKFFGATLGAAFHPEDQIHNYYYTDENGNNRPSFAPTIAERLQNLLDKAAAICQRENVDICAIRLTNAIFSLKGFDVDALNEEFAKLLSKHEGEEEVEGASKEEFNTMGFTEEWEKSYFAGILNAWDELCGNHEGLRGSGLGWFAGADFVGYPNPFDLYIGNGEEPYIF